MTTGRILFVAAAIAAILGAVGVHPAGGLAWVPLTLFFLALGLAVG